MTRRKRHLPRKEKQTLPPTPPPADKPGLAGGLYSPRFTPQDAALLEVMGNTLESEIALLRLHINGLAKKLEGCEYNANDLESLGVMNELIGKVVQANRVLAALTARRDSLRHAAMEAILLHRSEWQEVEK